MNSLNTRAFALACGVLWGGCILFMGLIALLCSWAVPFVDSLGKMYVGYDVSFVGTLIGTVWGFADGFIGGFILAWLYNKFAN